MDVLKLALLLHIFGFLGLFAAIVLADWTAWRLRMAGTLGQLRDNLAGLRLLPSLFGLSFALILLSGTWLSWGYIQEDKSYGWAIVSFLTLIVIYGIGLFHARRVAHSIEKQLSRSQKGLDDPKKVARDKYLQSGAVINSMLFLALIVVIVFQPDTVLAIAFLLTAVLVGWLADQQFIWHRPVETDQGSTTKR